MRLEGVVAIAAALLPILGGCDLFTRYEWHHPSATVAMRDLDERSCAKQAMADAGPPPVEPYRRYPTKKQVRRYQSETCSKKCAYRRADNAVNFHHDLEERAYRSERSRYDSNQQQAVAGCMTALGYQRREVSAE